MIKLILYFLTYLSFYNVKVSHVSDNIIISFYISATYFLLTLLFFPFQKQHFSEVTLNQLIRRNSKNMTLLGIVTNNRTEKWRQKKWSCLFLLFWFGCLVRLVKRIESAPECRDGTCITKASELRYRGGPGAAEANSKSGILPHYRGPLAYQPLSQYDTTLHSRLLYIEIFSFCYKYQINIKYTFHNYR